MKGWAAIMLSVFLAGSSFGYDERPIVPSDVPVQVRYQISSNGKSWSGGSVTLTNALTESMARNQLSQKFPNRQIRILGFNVR